MFTGLVQPTKILSIEKHPEKYLVCLAKPRNFKIKIGDSINIDGICSTVIKQTNKYFCVEYMEETLKKTTSSTWGKNNLVNIEPSLKANDLLGGHFVSGHIDCTGKIIRFKKKEKSTLMEVKFPKEFNKFLIEKGSIALNGISLTVFDVKNNKFQVSLINHTLKSTNLDKLK
ncbi:riboflavin synthase, partial [Patescibacteria group bacterium]|nr:riboflavin synthase [Patescibacteria group bacterium]